MLMGTKEVAKKYKVTNREVLYATKKGLIYGQKFSWFWVYESDDLPKKWPVRSKKKKRGN